MTPDSTDAEAAARASYEGQRLAIVAGDADALGEHLAAGFTLTHMTGYRQSRLEWLDQVASGEMAYHAVQDLAITVALDGDAPVLTARTRTTATIWEARGVWPLQLEIHFTRDDDRWVAAYTIATTW